MTTGKTEASEDFDLGRVKRLCNLKPEDPGGPRDLCCKPPPSRRSSWRTSSFEDGNICRAKSQLLVARVPWSQNAKGSWMYNLRTVGQRPS